jgi:nucleolar protein TMA23
LAGHIFTIKIVIVPPNTYMNSSAYLVKHGWLGKGHPLHPNGHGIKKPLLISKKCELLGVGKKKHDIYEDQWWARIFDSTLEQVRLGTDNNVAKRKTLSAAPRGRNCNGIGYKMFNTFGSGNLYDNFVRGEGLVGTIAQAPKHLQKESNMDMKRKKAAGRDNLRKLPAGKKPETSVALLRKA